MATNKRLAPVVGDYVELRCCEETNPEWFGIQGRVVSRDVYYGKVGLHVRVTHIPTQSKVRHAVLNTIIYVTANQLKLAEPSDDPDGR